MSRLKKTIRMLSCEEGDKENMMFKYNKKTKDFNLKDIVENEIIYCEREQLEDKDEEDNFPQYDKGEIDSYRKILTLIDKGMALDVFWEKNIIMHNKLWVIIDSESLDEDFDFDYYRDGSYIIGYDSAIIHILRCIEPSYGDYACELIEEERMMKLEENDLKVDEVNLQMILEKNIQYDSEHDYGEGNIDALSYALSEIKDTTIKEFEEIIREKAAEVLKEFSETTNEDRLEYLNDYYIGLEFVMDFINKETAIELISAQRRYEEKVDIVIQKLVREAKNQL